MQVPGRGPVQRKPNEAVLCLLIIIILISYYYILSLNYLIINYGEPSQPKPETEHPPNSFVLMSNDEVSQLSGWS